MIALPAGSCGAAKSRAAVSWKKNATAARESQGVNIRHPALIIKDKLARTEARHQCAPRRVDSRGYRDHLVHQKCHNTSIRSWN
jgi:hypothetical protein